MKDIEQEVMACLALKNKAGECVGFRVPIINATIHFIDSAESPITNWFHAMAFAESRGGRLPSFDQLRVVFGFRDEINTIAAQAGFPDFLSGKVWTCSLVAGGYCDAYVVDLLTEDANRYDTSGNKFKAMIVYPTN